jgi:hypothetical protein
MSVSFDISNANFVTLNDVNVSLAIGQFGGAGTRVQSGRIPTFRTRFTNPDWEHHTLAIDDKITIVLDSILRNVASADIAIVVSYKPWMLPFRREKLFRFVTFRRSDGMNYWRSWPLDELPPRF